MCHQGYCLTCAGRLENGGEVDQADSEQYYPEDREAGFVLLCTGSPRSNLRIRTHQAKAMREFRKSKNLPAPYSWNAG
jgi:ferredoxin